MTLPSPRPPRLAYLVSQYPMLSMIFIIREVLQLRQLGFQIDVASINRPDRETSGLTADEALESSLTCYIKPQGWRGALLAHVHAVTHKPAGYFRGLGKVFHRGGMDVRRLVYCALYFTEALMVGRWMTRRGHIHLHAHLGNQASTVGLFVKDVFGFGLSLTIHGPDEFYDAPGNFLTEKVVASDFVVCISDFARSQLMKLSPYSYWSKLVVSRLGVDPTVFAPQARSGPGAMFEILCVGRLVPAKGQHLLVEALAGVIRTGRSARLRLVGDGVDRQSLLAQVRDLSLLDRVVFEGAVNQDRIRELYAMADCFCIPSFAEGIPVVLMEAMAMEIPCISTHITGIPELIQNGVNGLLVAPSSIEGLVSAITRLIDDAEGRKMLGILGRERVVEQYDLAKNVRHLAEIFRERLQGTTGAPAQRM
jgi:colanic acid/amylovoran biosynthesis glycosyltransferase